MGSDTKQSVILIGRHAEAPKKPDGKGSIDMITDEAAGVMYDKGLGLIDTPGLPSIISDHTFLRHGPKVRTQYTGLALLAGIFFYATRLGRLNNTKEIDYHDRLLRGRVQIDVDTDLDVLKETMNMDIYARDGAAPIVNYWLNHPDATTHEGKQIESYTALKARLMRSMCASLLNIKNGEDFGFLGN